MKKSLLLSCVFLFATGCVSPNLYRRPDSSAGSFSTIHLQQKSDLPFVGVLSYEDPIACKNTITIASQKQAIPENVLFKMGEPVTLDAWFLVTSVALPYVSQSQYHAFITFVPMAEEYRFIFGVKANADTGHIAKGGYLLEVKSDNQWVKVDSEKIVERRWSQAFLQSGPWAAKMSSDELKKLGEKGSE